MCVGGGLVCWALELEAKGLVCMCVCVWEVWCAGHWGHTGKQTQIYPSSFFDTGVSPVPTLAFPHQLLFTTGHFSENDVMLCALSTPPLTYSVLYFSCLMARQGHKWAPFLAKIVAVMYCSSFCLE